MNPRFAPIRFLLLASVLGSTLAGPSSGYDQATEIVLATWKGLRRDKLGDARLRHPRSKPWLAFSEEGLQALESYIDFQGRDKEALLSLVRTGGREAARESRFFFDFLSDKKREKVLDLLDPSQRRRDPKLAVSNAYLELTTREVAALRKAPDSERLRWANEVHTTLEPSIKTRGRRLRQIALLPFAPFVYGWMGQNILREYRGPNEPEFERYRVYRPMDDLDRISSSSNIGDPNHLLRHFAPIIVQEVPEKTEYPPEVDSIGRLKWGNEPDGDATVRVDTSEPVVYAYHQSRNIAGREYLQLVYTHWYPEHPSLKFADAEAGKIEGLTLRITLDSRNLPIVYETVYNCGCYHRLYVSERLENAARREYGAPEKGKTYSIEKRIPWKIDLFVLDTFRDPLETQRPVLYSWAGNHLPGEVALEKVEDRVKGIALGEEFYDLRPYRELEVLPLGGRPTGIFNHNGLVYGADRPEAILLAPTGIYHTGTPRQRGTQLIHFDQADLDDPDLFVKHLRWPGVPNRPESKRR